MPIKALALSLLSLTWATFALAEPPMLISLLEPTPFAPQSTDAPSDNPFSASQKDQLSRVVQSLHNGRFADAKRIIAGVRVQYLSRTDEALLSIYKAYIAINEARFSDALRNTSQVASPDLLPDNYRIQWHDLRASAYEGLYQHIESVRERIWLEHLLVDAERLKKNRMLIWQSLLQVTSGTLDLLNPDSPPDILSGWISLALLYQNSHGYIEGDMEALNHWQKNYPLHPAKTFLANLSASENKAETKDFEAQRKPLSMKKRYSRTLSATNPQKIAVLLPMKGQHAALSKAIQKGILAAYYERAPKEQPFNTQIHFYDSSQLKALPKLYQTLRANKTDFIIGPLRKKAVRQLSDINQANIPMVALNNINRLHPKDILFFSLDPEAEAKEVAEQLWEKDIERVALLALDNAWGLRLKNTFLTKWQSLGGKILADANINPGKDLSGRIAKLLNVKQSQSRYQQFRRTIPEKVHFEPRVREDIQAIVLFTTPPIAKQIKPLLKFHFAGHLPLFSTSHIYSKKNGGPQEDLNAIEYCDIPLILEPNHQHKKMLDSLESHINPGTLRFFALGYDSYQIMLNFSALKSNPGLQLPGMTGILTLNETNHITRQLTWAKFHNGYPKATRNPYRP